MPYVLEKVPGGYYVKNKETGKRYSNRPLPKKNAMGQMKILSLYAKDERK